MQRRLKVPGFAWCNNRGGHAFYLCDQCRMVVRSGFVKSHHCHVHPKKNMHYRVIKNNVMVTPLPKPNLKKTKRGRRKKRRPIIIVDEATNDEMISVM